MIQKFNTIQETQTTIDSNELYALPSSKNKKKCEGHVNHMRHPQDNPHQYGSSFLQYLDQNGIRVLVHYIDKKLAQEVNKIDFSNFATKTDLQNITVDLSDYASKSYVNRLVTNNRYDDTEIREMIENTKVSPYCLKGSITDLADLEDIQNPEVGDTYILSNTGINVVWTGSEWEQFNLIIDLSNYIGFDDIQPITNDELDSIIYGS